MKTALKPSVTVETLKQEAAKNASKSVSVASSKRIDVRPETVPANKSKTEQPLRKALQQLAFKCMYKFRDVSSIFLYFDRKNQSRVSFSDFSYAVDELGLNYDRELIVQLFAQLDRDCDTFLKFKDFAILVSAAGDDSSLEVLSSPKSSSCYSNLTEKNFRSIK